MHQSEELFVCDQCFEDAGIGEFIEGNRIGNTCSFCGETSKCPIAADMYEVAEYIRSCLYQEYDHAENQLGWDGREGGWQGAPYWDTDELLFFNLELNLPNDDEGNLSSELVSLVGYYDWCESNAYGLNDEERPRFSWRAFCDVVMHHRRFFFSDYNSDDFYGEVDAPAEVLHRLFEYAETCGLFVTVPPDTRVFRARWQGPNTELSSALDLGPPPRDKANQANRMNPPGIVMFYASDYPETSLRETASDCGAFVVGEFANVRPFTVLDLTGVPPIPSLFEPVPDGQEFRPREVLKFLEHIANEMSKPIPRNDRVNVNYVPTQVVTEYVRSLKTSDGLRVDGIKYPSAVHEGYGSYVIFATQDNIVTARPDPYDERDEWLKLVRAKRSDVSCKQVARWRRELRDSLEERGLSEVKSEDMGRCEKPKSATSFLRLLLRHLSQIRFWAH